MLGSSKSPSFKIGETSAIFQEHGKIPVANEALIIDVKVGSTAGRLSLITRAGILSIPGDLFSGIDQTTLATSEHSTGLKLNWPQGVSLGQRPTSNDHNYIDWQAKKLEQERKKKDKVIGDGSIDQRQDDTDEKLAALRAELSQMAGDEDAALENDDVDYVGSGSVPLVQEPLTNSNNRTGTADISIPDAAAIHAARKRREMARQTEQDFIPLDDTKRYEGQFASKGRLVREDENDINDSEGEEGVITFSVARKRGFPALDRRKVVEAALANQELDEKSGDDEAEDEELKLWEDEQIRKGVKGLSVPLVQQDHSQTTEAITELTISTTIY